jgi:hypothetical protein
MVYQIIIVPRGKEAEHGVYFIFQRFAIPISMRFYRTHLSDNRRQNITIVPRIASQRETISRKATPGLWRRKKHHDHPAFRTNWMPKTAKEARALTNRIVAKSAMRRSKQHWELRKPCHGTYEDFGYLVKYRNKLRRWIRCTIHIFRLQLHLR